ncbi:MAG: four helix bundle protein [Chloroflexota bacterium]
MLQVYRITGAYPSEEKFGLVSQMRRAAVSVPANIAEGFKRRSQKDKIHFYNMAQASLEELKYFFILSNDLNYLNSPTELMTRAESVSKLLYKLMTSIENCSR